MIIKKAPKQSNFLSNLINLLIILLLMLVMYHSTLFWHTRTPNWLLYSVLSNLCLLIAFIGDHVLVKRKQWKPLRFFLLFLFSISAFMLILNHLEYIDLNSL